MSRIKLDQIALSRSGDKGNISDISLFATNIEVYELLKKEVTPERVKEHFAGLCTGIVERYEVPNVLALKFVLHDALGGGSASSLRMDNLGKSLSAALLRMEVEVPDHILEGIEIKEPQLYSIF
ncbi:AtuA-related protein [Neobacillus sp. C211]|uniref:AtuA-related protein n=1 Tax=unclassified Neobacillus TaxID=2675272 RepID=UPI00397B4ACB